ncbi:MAG: methyltransferase domain-containing protein [Anaerolineales bacterium]|jgi:ubiquinone/menaquinone biosynthesis C-methylase UbiE
MALYTLERLAYAFLWLILALIVIHTAVRIIRWFVKFPIPAFLVKAIDNPFRRKIQSPTGLVESLGVNQGMNMLEIGPGSGTYTQAFSDAVGEGGLIVAVDIERSVLRDLKHRIADIDAQNIYPLVADVHHLPFKRSLFDAVYMITVIGEIPAPREAFHSFFSVLKPGGKLIFSEFLLDPDFPLPRTLRSWAMGAGFEPHDQRGNLLTYTIAFQRPG